MGLTMSRDELDGKAPEIFCKIVLYLKTAMVHEVLLQLNKLSIGSIKSHLDPFNKEFIYVSFAEVYYEQYWDIDDALTEMFSKVEPHFSHICSIIDNFKCHSLIDIAVCVYETFPALLFSGKNMKKIHSLNADISIDPYYYGNVSNETEEKAETAP